MNLTDPRTVLLVDGAASAAVAAATLTHPAPWRWLGMPSAQARVPVGRSIAAFAGHCVAQGARRSPSTEALVATAAMNVAWVVANLAAQRRMTSRPGKAFMSAVLVFDTGATVLQLVSAAKVAKAKRGQSSVSTAA